MLIIVTFIYVVPNNIKWLPLPVVCILWLRQNNLHKIRILDKESAISVGGELKNYIPLFLIENMNMWQL